MKKTLWTMAAVVALVGCSNEELLNVDNSQVQEQNAIAFDTYVGDNAQTRASVIEIDDLQLNGFGVNAYYTGKEEFGAETEYLGNAIFMDNTKIVYNLEKGDWTYSPVKYWPNNTFVNGNGDTQYEMVSFFAYAPYKSPQIKFDETNRSKLNFTVENDALDQVDLIYHPANGNNNACDPTINLEKPSVNSRVSFNFQHALSRITFDVKAVVDETDEKGDNLLDGNTRINIKSVQLVSATDGEEDAPFFSTGVLDLTNGEWVTDETTQSFTFNGSHFYRAVDVNNTTADATDDVVQLTKFNPGQPLLNEDSYLMIIPQNFSSTNGYRIYIEYDVISEEVDNNGSSDNITSDSNTITNKIYSEPMNTTFEQGKAYKFTLLLGMTSVKFEADVAIWDDATDYDDEVWLPENEEENAFAYANGEIQIKNAADLAKMRDLVNSGAKYYVNETGNGVVTVKESRAYTRSGEAEVKEYAKASYRQVADIDLSGYPDWTPIGNIHYNIGEEHTEYQFAGKYIVDIKEGGTPYTISGLQVDCSDVELHAGLFGYVLGTNSSEYAELTNIYLVAPKIEGHQKDSYAAGGVLGEGNMVNITYCYIEEGSISGHDAGGIAGKTSGSSITIKNCINYGTKITGTFGVGGIVGHSGNTRIISCSNHAEVGSKEVVSKHVGGIVGNSGVSTDIIECSNHANITSSWTSGGIAGLFNTGNITASYNTGSISGDGETSHQGGIVGWVNEKAIITACYNTAESINQSTNAGGIVGFASADNIVINACYSTTTTFTGAATYGALVGNNVDDAGKAYNLSYSACYFTWADGLMGCGYAEEDAEGVTHVDDKTTTWEVATKAMNEVLAEWEYTLGEDKLPTVGPNTPEDEDNEEV